MANVRKKRLFDHIARLRRAERHDRDGRDIVAVRTALEEELGHTVSRALAPSMPAGAARARQASQKQSESR